MKTTGYCLSLLLLLTAVTVAAQPGPGRPPSKFNAAGTVKQGICLLYPTEGYTVTGKVTFIETRDGIRVVAFVTGLEPLSKHGIHIHENGDCSAVDALSAGGHFNPGNGVHGGPADKARHAGDLGNLEADMNGNASLDYIDPVLSLRGEDSVIGLSVVIKQHEDDLKTQPDGNSGARIACGVIGATR